jgi:hypothetical protein
LQQSFHKENAPERFPARTLCLPSYAVFRIFHSWHCLN